MTVTTILKQQLKQVARKNHNLHSITGTTGDIHLTCYRTWTDARTHTQTWPGWRNHDDSTAELTI